MLTIVASDGMMRCGSLGTVLAQRSAALYQNYCTDHSLSTHCAASTLSLGRFAITSLKYFLFSLLFYFVFSHHKMDSLATLSFKKEIYFYFCFI